MTERMDINVPEDCPEDGDMYNEYFNCPNCGEPFIDKRWRCNHAGDEWGGTASWYCPSCDENTITVNY